MAEYIFSKEQVDQMRRNPLHEVLRDLGRTARDAHMLETSAFKKLLGYITEVADGRDRREPMTDVPGTHRPQPRLRVLINEALGELGDLTWFRLNKIANQSRLPLKGMFTRMAASIGRLDEQHLANVVTALVSDTPDKKLLKLLNQMGGRVPHAGVDLFAKLSYLFRPDLYFLMPKKWGEESGVVKFIDNDLRKYCAVSRSLRPICEEVGFPGDVRATLFDRAVEMDPIHPTLERAINRSIGGALAWANVLDPGEGYVAGKRENDEIAMPLEVSSMAIRVRRGDMRLRNQLIRQYRQECAISGKCVKDLIEVAYIAPYPAGDVHSVRNAIPLRADLHTMWDLNLVAIHPQTLEVHISERMRGTYYESFAGTTIATPRDQSQPLDQTALRERWAHFRATEKANGASVKQAPAASSERDERAQDAPISEPEVEVLADLEPKRSGASGIWRAPTSATTTSNPAPSQAPASAFGPIGFDSDE